MTALIKRKSATQSFIEDAIAGGWTYPLSAASYRLPDPDGRIIDLQGPFLDPLAWQAAGKTRGWEKEQVDEYLYTTNIVCRYYQHRFIDHLADGKTIDEALAAISRGV